MSIDFHGGRVWSDITPLIRGRGKIHAAIAYLGKDAADRLPLRSGDYLVVNAAPGAVAGHATNPYAIEKFMDTGVHVYSSERLHAKVIATPREAVIGSANASAHSADSSEAIVISRDSATVKGVKKFVRDEIERSYSMDIDTLNGLKQLFDEARPDIEIPGVNRAPTFDGQFPRNFDNSYIAQFTDESDLTDDDIKSITEQTGRPAGFSVWVIQVPSREHAYEENSVVFFHNAGYFQPPALIAGPAIELPSEDATPKFGQCTWRKTGQRPYAYSTIERHFASHPKPTRDLGLDEEYYELDPSTSEVLLTRWFS